MSACVYEYQQDALRPFKPLVAQLSFLAIVWIAVKHIAVLRDLDLFIQGRSDLFDKNRVFM